MLKYLLIFCVFLIFLSNLSSQYRSKWPVTSSSINIQGSSAYIVSSGEINYEFVFHPNANHFGFAVGPSFLHTSKSSFLEFLNFKNSINLGIQFSALYFRGLRDQHFEISAGLNYYFRHKFKEEEMINYNELDWESGTYIYPTLNIGYRFDRASSKVFNRLFLGSKGVGGGLGYIF